MKKIVVYLLIAILTFSLVGCAELDENMKPNVASQDESSVSQEKGSDDKGADDKDKDEENEKDVKDEEKNKEDDNKEKVKDEENVKDKDNNGKDKGDNKPEKADKDDKQPEKNEDKPKAKSSGILYFSDENAEYLNAEERELGEVTAESLINALIEGPREDANRKTIPDGTKLIDVKVENGVAYVNFSKEFRANHWGGSAGETHTIYSIVNTLALDPDLNIDSVKILVDGETIDSLSGHMDTSQPIKPDLELSKHK